MGESNHAQVLRRAINWIGRTQYRVSDEDCRRFAEELRVEAGFVASGDAECNAGIDGGCGACETCDPSWWAVLKERDDARMTAGLLRARLAMNSRWTARRIAAWLKERADDCGSSGFALRESAELISEADWLDLETPSADDEHMRYVLACEAAGPWMPPGGKLTLAEAIQAIRAELKSTKAELATRKPEGIWP